MMENDVRQPICMRWERRTASVGTVRRLFHSKADAPERERDGNSLPLSERARSRMVQSRSALFRKV